MKESRLERIPLPFLRWRGFTIRMFLIALLPVLIVILAIVFLSQYLHLREMRIMVGDRNLRSVRLAADNIAGDLREKQRILLLYEKSTAQTRAELDLAAYFDGGAALYDRSTNQFEPLTAGFFLNNSFADESAQSWPSLADGWAAEADLLLSTLGAQTVLAVPGLAGEEDVYLLGLFDTQTFLRGSLAHLMQAANVSVWIEDGDSRVLYQATTGAVDKNAPPLEPAAQDGHVMEGVQILPAQQGNLVLSYAPVSGTDWQIVYAETWGNITSSLINTTFYTPLILIPLLVIAALALWFGARQIVIPLQKLQRQSLRLGKGDFAEIENPVGGIEEIQNLQQQLVLVSRELQLAQGNLHQYIGSLTAGVENERQNLARELHDDTLQSLITLQQRVQMAEMQRQQTELGEPLDLAELKNVIQHSIQNMRRLLRGLRPAYLDDFGLISALKILVEETDSAQPVQIRLSVQGEERRLPAHVELALYRITQEALSNVLRHAQAQQAEVSFVFDKARVTSEIKDDGLGFAAPQQLDSFASGGHFGLLGMSERADLVGAKLEIISSSGQGTTVRVVCEV
jgi:signal transduction histidine kinase